MLNNFFNDYTAISLLGKGNFAKVYHVKNKTSEASFAAKIFEKENVSKTPKSKKALLTEIKVMQQLDHPYIMKLYQIYEGEHHIYLIFNLMPGRDLFERVIARKRYSEKNAAIVLKQLLDAVRHLHKKGIVHRDIKLENILLTSEASDCEVCLADFGLATFMAEYDPNIRCGTPGYVAPEVLKNQSYGYNSDIFSMGVVLFTL